MPDTMIHVENLTRFFGKIAAVSDLSFTINEGECVGLLGLNGAGKTTCIKLLTGFLEPDQGKTLIRGLNSHENPMDVRRLIGYLPETPPLYPELCVRDYLHFVARLRGVAELAFEEEFERVTTMTGLEQARMAFIRTLSLGYRKRVGIAQALIGSPPVLIFDEPISGLDPKQIIEVRKLLRSLAGKHTILLSSHILTEVSKTCDKVIIIHKGCKVGELTGQALEKLEENFMNLTGGSETHE